jgi:hypothetical protein
MRAGFTPDSVKSVCSAPKNDVISLGVGPAAGAGAAPASNMCCKDAVEDCARVRASVFRIEAKEPAFAGGVTGRLGADGDTGLAPRIDVAGVASFFFPKERRKDHSDSNWMSSNSVGRAAWSRMADSIKESMRRSTYRMMNTDRRHKKQTDGRSG